LTGELDALSQQQGKERFPCSGLAGRGKKPSLGRREHFEKKQGRGNEKTEKAVGQGEGAGSPFKKREEGNRGMKNRSKRKAP